MMWNLDKLVQSVTLLASFVAAFYAWRSKLGWSNEFAKMKDAVIAAKQARIDNLEAHVKHLESELVKSPDATHIRLEDFYKNLVKQYEETHDRINHELESLRRKLQKRDIEIATIKAQNSSLSAEQLEALETRDDIVREIGALEFQVERMRQLPEPPPTLNEQGGAPDILGSTIGSVAWLGNEVFKAVTFGLWQ